MKSIEQYYKNELITNFKKALDNGGFVTTDAIVIASAIKGENLQRATSHFDSVHTMIQAFSNTITSLQKLYFSVYIDAQFQDNNSVLGQEIKVKGKPVGLERNLLATVLMFQPETIEHYNGANDRFVSDLKELLSVTLDSHLFHAKNNISQ